MKKYGIFLMFAFMALATGCSIDYDSYYQKYGYVYNKDNSLNSQIIEDNVLNFPNDNTDLIEKYSEVYSSENDSYKVYSTYYSSKYDTLYIAYDSISNPVQTINSRELALIEEHLLNYFVSDSAKTDYNKYVKVIRIYPDYKSSVCRTNDDEEVYSKIEGCAKYDAYDASVNLNGLTSIDRFFNPYTYTDGEYRYTQEPKRDTFAHEFGHVSTYYNMILKGDDSYIEYLKLRLADAYDSVYPEGFPTSYDTGYGYYTQPVEILADDYVELYYDTSKKASNDYYEYDLEYTDLRNSLTDTVGVSQYLKNDRDLYNAVKEYYNLFINKEYNEYENPIIVNANGNTYNTIHDIKNNKTYIELDNKNIVALGELTIDSKVYYRVILSNIVYSDDVNIRSEYSSNIGYILKENANEIDGEVLYFTKYDDVTLDHNSYLPITEDINLYPYYDFSYLIINNDKLKIYNYIDSTFTTIEVPLSQFN